MEMKKNFHVYGIAHPKYIFIPQVYICKYVFVVIIMKVIIKISCLLHEISLVVLLHCVGGGGGGGGGGSIPA